MLTIAQAFDIAVQHHQAGRLAEAEGLYRKILAADPRHADSLHLLGVIAHATGALDPALDLIGQAIALSPATALFHNNLGNALRDRGRLADALAAYREALRLQPDLAMALNNLGAVLKENGDLDGAITAYERALSLQPNVAATHSNLGNALGAAGRAEEAVAAYRRAIEIDPAFSPAHVNLGAALMPLGRHEEAAAAFRRVIELQPRFAAAHCNLGGVLREQGRMDEAIACYERAVQCEPTSAIFHSNLLAALDFSPGITLRRLFEAHRVFDERHAAPLRASWRPHQNTREPDRPLRIGFVSPRFTAHPVTRFSVRLFENLDRAQFHTTCYSDTPDSDAMTARVQASTSVWCDTAGLSDEQLAARIHADRIDLLFDLAGHTVGNRLLVFARKPAPMQITWLDYAGTTGLSAIDYILADPRQIPPGAEPWYSEKVLRMPDDYICYDPPDDAPPVAPLPALSRGHVTFASFNAPAKITAHMVGVWSRILECVPHSRLLLKNRGMDDADAHTRFQRMFAEHGIDPTRVELLGWSPSAEVRALYHEVDLALDTSPYNGGLTTCEALWMGVPVVTCPGETFASRHSLAHLTAAGFTDTIACDFDDYVKIAVALSSDLPRLAALRAGLRDQMAASPLCDGPQFAKNFAALMRRVWSEWAANSAAVTAPQ